MSTPESEVLPTSTTRSTSARIVEVPPDDGSLRETSPLASRRNGGPAVPQNDPSDDLRADFGSIHQQSLWDSGRSSPAILQDKVEESGDYDLPGSTTKHQEDDPGCRGKKGYVYPFKLKPEERYPMKDPASYTEFEKRYPPDRFGEEASDNARVWKLYRDRVTERDEDQIDGWNKTLDILLIFAGLFSAVATAFIIEAYKQLQPDYTEIMAKAFIASLNGTVNADLASFNRFSRPPLARCVNTLWFLSLTLALVVALLAILAKQWLGEYTSRMRRHIGSQRRWAWRHLVYHAGLEKWGMDAFISALPLMLHLSLTLFLVGLVAFLTDLDWVVVAFVLPLTVAVVVFYVGATVAPLWFGDCPTATPVLNQGRRVLEFLHADLRHRLLTIRRSIGRRLKIQSWCEAKIASTSWNTPAYDEEVLLEGTSGRRDATVLHWMVTSLPAVEEVEVALDAMGSLDPLEHRHEFHLDSDGVASHHPADGDILCLGPVIFAATARCQRLCEGAAGSDPAAVARCIRTLLALSFRHCWDVGLRIGPIFDARISRLLVQWAAIPTHDLNFLCNTFLDHFHSYENQDTVNIVRAWTDDAGPITGETPFLPSSIALCFLGPKHQYKPTKSIVLIYSTLSASVASSALDPARRCAALAILHDAAVVYGHNFRDIKHTEARSAMRTAEQLHLRAMSTIAILWNSSLEEDTEGMRAMFSINFARLVSTFPGVETLTIEHISYASGILDMASRLTPEDGKVVRQLLKLVEDYLCRLTDWSEDAGEMTRRLIELYASLPNSDPAVLLASRLSFRSHHHSFRTSEMAVRHSLVNLLLPGAQGELSAWRTLCNTSRRTMQAKFTLHLADTLASLLITLIRREFDVTNLVEEFLGDGRLHNLIIGAPFEDRSHLAQHVRELSPGWWEDFKTKLQSLASVDDNGHATTSFILPTDSLVNTNDGGSINMSSQMQDFIQKVEALDGHCQACDFDELKWEEATQNAVSASLLARTYHQARRAITGGAWRGRSPLVSDVEAHELPVTAPRPVTPHASHASLTRASVTGAHDGPV